MLGKLFLCKHVSTGFVVANINFKGWNIFLEEQLLILGSDSSSSSLFFNWKDETLNSLSVNLKFAVDFRVIKVKVSGKINFIFKVITFLWKTIKKKY